MTMGTTFRTCPTSPRWTSRGEQSRFAVDLFAQNATQPTPVAVVVSLVLPENLSRNTKRETNSFTFTLPSYPKHLDSLRFSNLRQTAPPWRHCHFRVPFSSTRAFRPPFRVRACAHDHALRLLFVSLLNGLEYCEVEGRLPFAASSTATFNGKLSSVLKLLTLFVFMMVIMVYDSQPKKWKDDEKQHVEIPVTAWTAATNLWCIFRDRGDARDLQTREKERQLRPGRPWA